MQVKEAKRIGESPVTAMVYKAFYSQFMFYFS